MLELTISCVLLSGYVGDPLVVLLPICTLCSKYLHYFLQKLQAGIPALARYPVVHVLPRTSGRVGCRTRTRDPEGGNPEDWLPRKVRPEFGFRPCLLHVS